MYDAHAGKRLVINENNEGAGIPREKFMTQAKKTERVALIVGAADEIVEAIALRFAAQGTKVALCGGAEDRLNAVAARIKKDGGQALAAPVNAADPQAVKACVEFVIQNFGKIDILVNSPAEPAGFPLSKLSAEDFAASVNTILEAQCHFMRETVPGMRSNGYGRVINIGSLAYLGNPRGANVAAAQAGLFGLIRSVALEAGREGVTVNSVIKGDIENSSMSEEERGKISKGIPVRRMGTPADIANAVGFLAGNSSKYVTGQTLFVCGGKSAKYSMSV